MECNLVALVKPIVSVRCYKHQAMQGRFDLQQPDGPAGPSLMRCMTGRTAGGVVTRGGKRRDRIELASRIGGASQAES